MGLVRQVPTKQPRWKLRHELKLSVCAWLVVWRRDWRPCLTMYWHGPIQLLIVEDELYVYDRGSYRGSRFQVFSLGGAYRRTVFGEDLSNLRVCQFVYAHGRLYACETDPCDACICVLTIEGATVQIYENPWAKLLHSAVVDGGALVLLRSGRSTPRFQVFGGI